jgi:DNA-binding NtrC family response regulator
MEAQTALRVLREGEYTMAGARRSHRVRIIAATIAS